MKCQHKKDGGFTLIELVVTIVLLGILAVPLFTLIANMMGGVGQHSESTEAVNLGISKMEEAVTAGVAATEDSGYGGRYYWVRDTTRLKGAPADSLVKVEILIKRRPGSAAIFSLINHLAID